jgi:hypothetical protein
MWRIVSVGFGLFVVGFALVCFAASQSQFTYRHPRNPNAKIIVSKDSSQVVLSAPPAAVQSSATPSGTPRIVAAERQHDFGFSSPLAHGEHDFVVKNLGDGPLRLNVKSTTCKCTVANVEDNTIPPGGEGKVHLAWTTPPHGPLFSQSATVTTNDPLEKELQLTVMGSVRTLLGADVEELSIDMDPDKPAGGRATIYSQEWPDFEIVDAKLKKTSVEGFTWKQQPVSGSTSDELKATSSRDLTIQFPASLPTSLHDHLMLTVRPLPAEGNPLPESAGDESTRQLEIPVNVQQKLRLSIYGPYVRSNGTIEMGEAQHGVAKTVKLQIKIRDRDPSLQLAAIETTPSYLKAEVTPHLERSTQKEVPGLYDLVITIPSDAPVCTYLGDVMGQLRIISKHPRLRETALGLKFAVLPQFN